MTLRQAQQPYWTIAWTRWGTRCSALVQGDVILKALDGFTHIDAEDIAAVLPRQQKAS